MATYAISDRNTLKQDDSMEEPGYRLKRVREKLHLTLRDVETASQVIVDTRGSLEYRLNISRLSEIENHRVVPTIYRLYSICAIYRLDYMEVLSWYAVFLSNLPADAVATELRATHPIDFAIDAGDVIAPLSLDPGIDIKKTAFLNRLISKWGKLPLALLNTMQIKKLRFGFVGSEDWNMYPLIRPGSLVTIDESQRKILNSGWNNEFERPIYFLEHHNGYCCCWCTLHDETLILQPHPNSQCSPQVFKYPEDIDIVGQVTGVAMLLDLETPRNTRS